MLARALDLLDHEAALDVRDAIAVEPEPLPLPALKLRLLGAFSLSVGSHLSSDAIPTGSRIRELFVYLALRRDGRRREEISADLWPDTDTGPEMSHLYTTLHRLRSALFPEVVVSEGPSWSEAVFRVNSAAQLDVDVHNFEEALQSAVRQSDPQTRRTWLVTAVEAYGGQFFTECYSDWAEQTRRRLEQRHAGALAQLADLDWKGGRYRDCLNWCQRLVEFDPLAEPVHYRVLACYEQLGEPLAGVLHYRRYVHELGGDIDGAASAPRTRQSLSARIAQLYQRLESGILPSANRG